MWMMKDTQYIGLLKKLFSSFFESKDGIFTTHIFGRLQLFDSNIDGTPPLPCFSPTKDESYNLSDALSIVNDITYIESISPWISQ